MPKSHTNKGRGIKGWYVDEVGRDFLISWVYLNKKNAELVCAGENMKYNRMNRCNKSYFSVIPVRIVPIKKKKR